MLATVGLSGKIGKGHRFAILKVNLETFQHSAPRPNGLNTSDHLTCGLCFHSQGLLERIEARDL